MCPEDLIRLMDEANVDKAIISQLTTNMIKDNEAVLKAVKLFPDRLLGYAHIDPRDPDAALRELDRIIDLAFVGVKMHSNLDHFVPWDRCVFKVMERIQENQLPVLFHTGEELSRPLQIAYLAKHFPEVPVILGHMGLWIAIESIPAAKLSENVYLETSIQGEMPALEEAVRELGSERVLFGTDIPFSNYRVEKCKIESLKISENDKKKILGENAVRIFHIRLGGGR
jgi:predicted TIM-barrel fold metal-dependent hydrolase